MLGHKVTLEHLLARPFPTDSWVVVFQDDNSYLSKASLRERGDVHQMGELGGFYTVRMPGFSQFQPLGLGNTRGSTELLFFDNAPIFKNKTPCCGRRRGDNSCSPVFAQCAKTPRNICPFLRAQPWNGGRVGHWRKGVVAPEFIGSS